MFVIIVCLSHRGLSYQPSVAAWIVLPLDLVKQISKFALSLPNCTVIPPKLFIYTERNMLTP